MQNTVRFGAILFLLAIIGSTVALSAADAPKTAAEAKQQYADALRQADADSLAKERQERKILIEAISNNLSRATTSGTHADIVELVELRHKLQDPSQAVPPAGSVSYPAARNAVADYEAARKKDAPENAAARVAACHEYIAKLDQILKQAMHAEDLAVANEINAIKTSVEMELKVGLGRFPSNPVMLYTFDPDTVTQGDKPRILDLSGHGNDILLDQPVKFVPVSSGSALRLLLPRQLHSMQVVGISGKQPRTLSFWLSVDDVPGGGLHDFLDWGSGGNGARFGAMISQKHFVVWGYGSGMDWDTPLKVEAKAWHHHAVSYDGATVNWYVDGKSIGTHHLDLNTVPGVLSIGGIDGEVQEVAIYDRVLNGDEINLLGHHGTGPIAPPEVVVASKLLPPATQAVASKTADQPAAQAVASGGPAPMTQPVASKPPEPTDFPIDGEFFSLAGQAGLPQYLKCEQSLVGDFQGIHGGMVRTTATDFFEKDFVLDIVFALTRADVRKDALVSIGDNDNNGPLTCHLHYNGTIAHAQLGAGREGIKPFAPFKPDVTNLLRIEKKGDVITYSITADFKGRYRPDFSTTIPSLKATAPHLNRLNSNLCFGGSASFKAIRLEVEGKEVDAGPVLAKLVEPPANEGWIKLEPGAALPAYLDGSTGVSFGKDGMDLSNVTVRTKDRSFLNKDFMVDIVFAYPPEDRHEMRFGIGENGYDGGNWIVNSVTALLHGPAGDGHIGYTFHAFYDAPSIGNLGKDHPGPNFFRFQKHGSSLLMAASADYNDKYEPDFAVILPSLRWQAPYLNDKNSGLFFGGGGTIQRIRMYVDGKPLGGDAAPAVATTGQPANPVNAPTTKPAIGNPREMISLAGTAGLPPFFHASPDTLADAKGLSGGEIHTAATDLIDHNFIFDLLFDPSLGDRNFYVTLGEENAIQFRVTDAGKDGGVALNIPQHEWIAMGKIGATLGPHLVRVEKRGNTLTFSFCPAYTGTFNPDFVRTIPDLKSAAPALTRLNSGIHVHGNGYIQSVGLSIDGKDQSKLAGATASGGPTPPAEHTSSKPATQSAVAALDSPVNDADFLKLTGPKLPTYFETQHGLKYTPDGLPLKDVHIRTRDADLIDKDFLLDIVFHFTGDRETMMIGLGADEREGNWNHKSVVCRIESPPGGGYARIVMDKAQDQTIGSFGNNPGPHMLRVQKRGNTLTFALCLNYKDTFTPDFIKTLPDLRGVSPLLDSKNSRIFIGDGGVADKIRLLIDGKVINPEAGPAIAKASAADRLSLESDRAKVISGLGDASLLVLDGQTLRQLDADGLTVTHTWTLPGTYQFIGERKKYFVAMSDETKSLDFIDKATMKITRSLQMDYFRRLDLCPNPLHPISYVSVDKASGRGGFIQSILIVDEITGEVREPMHVVGTFLKTSRDGTRLYAAYKDIYKRGEELLFNPEHIDVVPVYGNIDILIVYDITKPNHPVEIAAKNEAGGNAQGLALSLDGKRVSYLSYVGYPLYSNNISAWDPEDLTKRPILYSTKANHADCKKLAFHPMLPIAAAPAETGAACFDRETGQFEPDRLDLHSPIDNAKVHDLTFAPDGKSLVLEMESQGDYFLQRVKLKLSDDEAATVKQGLPPVQTAPLDENGEPHLRT